MISQETPETDDETITAEEVLLRFCKTPMQLTLNKLTGIYELSDQIFAALQGGCSIEFESLVERDETTVLARHDFHVAYATVEIKAGEVRELEFRDAKGQPAKGLKVAYTPIPAAAQFGPNSYHGDIFPGPSRSANKALTRKSRLRIGIDQEKARDAYARRLG